mgnify:CR=1 FL=1
MINPINILVWNVWGASRAASQRFLHKMCSQHAVQMLVLPELMTDVAQLDVITCRLQFPNSQAFLDGKIWIFWSDNSLITFNESGDQLVHMEVT